MLHADFRCSQETSSICLRSLADPLGSVHVSAVTSGPTPPLLVGPHTGEDTAPIPLTVACRRYAPSSAGIARSCPAGCETAQCFWYCSERLFAATRDHNTFHRGWLQCSIGEGKEEGTGSSAAIASTLGGLEHIHSAKLCDVLLIGSANVYKQG